MFGWFRKKSSETKLEPKPVWLVYYAAYKEDMSANCDGYSLLDTWLTGRELANVAVRLIRETCLKDSPEFTKIILKSMSKLQ